MDFCCREYMFASDLITNVMSLYSSKWEPGVKASYENKSPFTPTVKKAVDYIWYKNKESINDLFSTVLQLGTIDMINYEVAVKFALLIVTEDEYDEIKLLRYCVIVAGYATLFYQNGLTNVPDHCLQLIYDTIITFTSKNEFNDESWYHIELHGDAYTKDSQSEFSTAVKPCFVKLSKIVCTNRNLQEVCDRNAVKITNKNHFPKAIEESFFPYITSENVSCRTTTSKGESTNLPETKNVKRKRTKKKHKIKKVEGELDLYTKATTNDEQEVVACSKTITKELSVTTKHWKSKVIHKNKATRLERRKPGRPKKIAKILYKCTKITGFEESFLEVADTRNVTQLELESKNTGKICPLTKTRSTEDKSFEDKIEMIDVINLAVDETIRHCEKIKCIECAINKLKATRHQINEMKDSKCKSNSKNRLKTVTMGISEMEKYTDDKYASEKTTTNKVTAQKISGEGTHRVCIDYTDNVYGKNNTVSEEVSEITGFEKKVKENRRKSNKIKSNKYNQNKTSKGNKLLKWEVTDNKLVTAGIMSTYYEKKNFEKIDDNGRNVETTQDDIDKINIAYDIVAKNSDDKYAIVNDNNITMEVSKSNHSAKEGKRKSKKIKRMQNESTIPKFSLYARFQNATEKPVTVPFTNANQESNVGVLGMEVSKSNHASKKERKLKIMKIKRIQNESNISKLSSSATFQNATEKAVTVLFTNSNQESNVDVLATKVSECNHAAKKAHKLKIMKIKRMQNESNISLNTTAGSFQSATGKAETVPFTVEYQASNVDVSSMKVSNSNDSAKKERKLKIMTIKRILNESSISLNATAGTSQNATEKAVEAPLTNKD